MIKKGISLILFLLFVAAIATAQKAEIYGYVLDKDGKPFNPGANIALQGISGGAITNSQGKYFLKVPVQKEVLIRYSHATVKPKYRTIILKEGERREINITLDQSREMDTIEIVSRRNEYTDIIHIDPIKIGNIPAPSGDVISAFVKSIPGVFSNNELSSQYSVRGGNFDENLVYVNGIEIQRPMLIKSGQQEGLSFANSSLVDNIKFSAGGFSAYYGDKMASVMDVSYKRPKEFAGSASISLLGESIHLEGVGPKNRFRFLLGYRHKSNQYILNSLDTDGDFKPSFRDFQIFMAYDLTDTWELSFLGNYANNKYNITPQTRKTNFGNIFEALRFTVYFEGHELDQFKNYMGALNLRYKLHKTQLDFTASAYRTIEDETYDIIGEYWLDVLENDLGKDEFGEVAFNKGVGTYMRHARNYLDGVIATFQHRGNHDDYQWGMDIRHDIIDDQLSEWRMIDSAGYSLPHPMDNIGNMIPDYDRPNIIELNEVVKAKQLINSNRYSAYLMRDWKWSKKDSVKTSSYKLNVGLRSNYWDFSNEFLLSPRISLLINPASNPLLSYRISGGLYSQPPFYREMRYHNGEVNHDIKAQKSAQILFGSDLFFNAWNRPFKFTAEAYCKYLWDLIPYEMEDVRLRYFAENNAIGYVAGLDLKLHGEFVQDAESWIGISLMQTQEDIKDDYYYEYYNADGERITSGLSISNEAVDSVKVEPGFIPRPTDQRITFNIFFQDYIPRYPTYKVHLNLIIATGLPFGPPTHKRYQQTSRYPAYRRVDVGFSKQLVSEETKFKSKSPLRFIKAAWLSIDVFNLLQIDNTLSYIWISDVNGYYYSIPNYLTSRQLNFNLRIQF